MYHPSKVNPTPACAVLMSLTLLATLGDERLAGAEPSNVQIRGVTGYDDAIIVCGPGTDAAFDSPEGIARLIKRLKRRGYSGIYFRVSEGFMPKGKFSVEWPSDELHPVTNFLFVPPHRTLQSFDVLGTMLREGEKQGVQVWAWYPTIYSNGAPPEGPGFTQKWLYENRFGHENPHVLSIDRKGNKHYQIWEYAYPEARAAKVAEFVYLAKRFGVKRFVACLRTEAGQMQPPPRHADQFGFNAPVVEEMKRRYDVDILTDPRFDYESDQFDVNDAMLENWRNLRGEYLTQFYRELRVALEDVHPDVKIAVQLPGERVGSCLGNWRTDWRTWIDEGLVDEISFRETLDNSTFLGTEDDPRNRGYLDIDKPDAQTIRDYIAQSERPDTTLILQGGPSVSYESPPENVDGWRIDLWPELFGLSTFQRWEQWNADVADFGHIKFLETDFDDFPERDNGYGGGYGEFAHRPDLRRCPGYWFTLGEGRDSLPFVQGDVRRGPDGLAMKLTRAADGSANLTARHCSYHDRTAYPFWTDTAITTGRCRLEYWIFRPDQRSSFVNQVKYQLDKAAQIGVLVSPGTGAVSYLSGDEYKSSSATIGEQQWQRIAIDVDLEARTYSATVEPEEGDSQDICRDVPYSSEHNALNWIDFSPQGDEGNVVYLDDVAWRWRPARHFAPPGESVLLNDGFESVQAGATIDGAESPDGAVWQVLSGRPEDVRVDHTLSHGDEYHSLRFFAGRGAATATSDRLKMPAGGELVFDFDMLPRSDRAPLYVTPTPGVKTPGETGAALVDMESGEPIAAVRVIDGVWHCWTENRYASTERPADIDVFSRLQIAVDPQNGVYRVALRVMGEAPEKLWEGRLGGKATANAAVGVRLESQCEDPRYDAPAFDNIRVTQRAE